MNTVLIILGTAVAFIVTVFLSIKNSRSSGKKEGAAEAVAEIQSEIRKEEIRREEIKEEELKDVAEIRDRLDSDPAYAERVRDRFTRP